MRKILLSLLAGAALTASAQKQLVSVDNYSVADDGTETYSGNSGIYYYDQNNQNTLTLTTYSKTLMTYNEKSLPATSTSYSWDNTAGWTSSAYSTYTFAYDEEGNLITQTDGNGSVTTYSGYENGVYSKMTTPYYEGNFKNYFNDSKQLIQQDQLMTDGTVNQRTYYTYNADGSIASTRSGYVSGDELTYETDVTYTYNADGTLHTTLTSGTTRWGKSVTKSVYNYTEMSASYVPQNVTATVGQNSTVALTWNAVSGATAYVVIYDQQADTVTTTSYTTGMLLDGIHDFYVQAVIGGEGRNISAAATATVKDTGKLPATNFAVTGVEEGTDSWGSTAYNTTVQWTMPETTSTITEFKVYYGTDSWSCTSLTPDQVTVVGSTATATVPLSAYNIGTFNYDTYEYDLGVAPLSVVIVYTSGAAEASNIVYWDYANNKDVTTGVAAVKTTAVPVACYSASGAKQTSATKGINIVRMSDGTVHKVLVK